MSLAAKIVWYRRRSGCSVTKAAGKLGIPPAILLSWERGEGGPDEAERSRLCELYGITIHELSEETTADPPRRCDLNNHKNRKKLMK